MSISISDKINKYFRMKPNKLSQQSNTNLNIRKLKTDWNNN